MRSNAEIKDILDAAVLATPELQAVLKRDVRYAALAADAEPHGWNPVHYAEWFTYVTIIAHAAHIVSDITSAERTRFLESLHPSNRKKEE